MGPGKMKTVTSSTDRSALIRIASSLPKGSEERRAILVGLKTAATRWLRATQKKAGSVMYHLTDNAKFKLNPKYAPEDNSISIDDRSGRPGIYLGADVEKWVNGFGYWRPFVVEFEVDPSVKDDPGVGGRWGGELFVPASSFDKLTIKRVIPLDAHAREEFGEYGWIEEALGLEFDTGNPIPQSSGMGRPSRPPPGYRYPGPDVRKMPSADANRLKKDLRKVKG